MTTAVAKVLNDGTQVPVTDQRTDHIAVLFDDGVMAYAHSIGQGPEHDALEDAENEPFDSFADAEAGVKKIAELGTILGHKDWEFATDKDAERYFINRDFFDPAVDPNLFPGIRPRWHWVNKPAAWSSASAWFVGFYYGLVGNGPRGNLGFALAVRRAGQ